MNKQGKGGVTSNTIVVALIIGFVAIAGVLFYTLKPTTASVASTATGLTVADLAGCPDDKRTDLKIRLIDELASSATYVNASIYGVNMDTGVASLLGVAGGSSAGITLTDAIDCGANYEISVRVDQNGTTNGLEEKIVLDSEDTARATVELMNVKITDFGNLRARAFDNENNNFVDDNNADSTRSDYDEITSSDLVFYSSTDNSNTTKTIVAGDTLDYVISLKTEKQNQEFGCETWFAVDTGASSASDATDWDEDTLVLSVGGKALEDITDSISTNDRSALSAYDRVYKLGDKKALGETETAVRIQVTTGDGINADKDVKMRMLAVGCAGVYESAKNPSELLSFVAFRDDTSDTELASSEDQIISIDVA